MSQPHVLRANMETVVLLVAEKPSLALAIAGFLSDGQHTTRHGGATDVHDLTRPFRGARTRFRVTSVKGHVFGLDFEQAYQSWDRPPAELFHAGTVKTPTSGAVISHLRHEASGCSDLLLFLDCDREGENICFEVMHIVLPMLRPSNRQQVWRAKFSAVSAASVATAMADLREPNEHESSAVDARQELDLKVGVAFTRFLTHHCHDHFKRLGSSTVSYGPCQTPTLGFVVQRHEENVVFEPEVYWQIGLSLQPPAHEPSGSALPGLQRPPGLASSSEQSTSPLEVTWERGRTFDRGVVSVCLRLVRAAGSATLSSLVESTERRARPIGLNTVQMLKIASKALGIGAQRAMSVAESLYMAGYLSYPRTESTAYPKGFDFRTLVSAQVADDEWGEHARWLLEDGHMDSRSRGVDAGDHPPITPMAHGTRAQLSSCAGTDACRLYALVARTFLASLSPDALLRVRRATFDAGGEHFSASGRELVDEGWLRVMPHMAPSTSPLPTWLGPTAGQVLQPASLQLLEGTTSAPGPLSESDLIGLMERDGIGTDASIPSHIGTIESRRYVRLTSGRCFEPTALGLALIRGIRSIDAELVQPTVRSHVEAQLELIAKGEARRAAVVAHILHEFESKFAFFAHRIGALNEVLAASFGGGGQTQHLDRGGDDPPADGGTDGSRVGGGLPDDRRIDRLGSGEASHNPPRLLCRPARSGHYLCLLLSPTPKLHDPRTEEVWHLPLGGTFKPYNERRCPVCDFELLLYCLSGRGGQQIARAFPLCPHCYNEPPFAGGHDASAPGRCSRSPHPEEHPIVSELSLCACPETADQGGKLLLEPSGGPNWRLISSRGSFHLLLPPFVHSLSVGAPCGCAGSCRLLQIEFQRNRSPLEDGSTSHAGCVLSDELIHDLCQCTVLPPRGGKGGGKGKGGKGKGGKGKGGKSGGRGGMEGRGRGGRGPE